MLPSAAALLVPLVLNPPAAAGPVQQPLAATEGASVPLQVAGTADGLSAAAEDGELFPWQEPSSRWAPLEIHALIRARGEYNDGTPLGAEDGSRFVLDDARLWLTGALEDSVTFQFTLAAGEEGAKPAGEVELLEGYGEFAIDERHHVRLGQFRRPFLRSALAPKGSLAFFERTEVAKPTNRFDLGVQAQGRYELLDLTFALQNGDDDAADGSIATARAELHPLGGGVPFAESLFRSEPETRLSLALAYSDDSSLAEGGSWAIDGAWRANRWQVLGEYVDHDADVGGSQPFSVSVVHMLFRDEWEVGGRYTDLDDAGGAEVWSAVLKRYFLRGRIAAHIEADSVSSSDPAQDGTRFMFGLSLSL